MNLINLKGEEVLPRPAPKREQKPIYLGMPSEEKSNWLNDFGDEVLGALTGYTPAQFNKMRSGEITVDASGNPMYAKTGKVATPDARSNPMSIGEFGTGTFLPAKKLGVDTFEPGSFSDIYQRKTMKWLDDTGSKVRTRDEIAEMRRKKNVPEGFDKLDDEGRAKALGVADADIKETIKELDKWPIPSEEARLKGILAEKTAKFDWMFDPDYETDLVKTWDGMTFDLDEVLDHPDLYKRAPYLRKFNVHPQDLSGSTTAGKLSGENITLDNSSKNTFRANEDGIDEGTLLHEVQHGIQDREGWVSGTNPRSASVEKRNKFYDAKFKGINRTMQGIEKQNDALKAQKNVARDNGNDKLVEELLVKIKANNQYIDKLGEKAYGVSKRKDELQIYLNQLGEQQARAVGDAKTIGVPNVMLEKDPYSVLKGREGSPSWDAAVGSQNILPQPELLNFRKGR